MLLCICHDYHDVQQNIFSTFFQHGFIVSMIIKKLLNNLIRFKRTKFRLETHNQLSVQTDQPITTSVKRDANVF